MSLFEIVSLALNVLLVSGGLITLVTLRAKLKDANAQAKRAEIDNETAAMENFQKYIVDPLKREVESLRNEVSKYKVAADSARQEMIVYQEKTESLERVILANNREMARFRRALEKISGCEYESTCPVKKQLKDKEDEKLD